MTTFAANSVLGQEKTKNEIQKILDSDRLGHAYLIAGPPGVGKKPLALAFAEAVNGVSNLSELGAKTYSGKSSWMNHPDIHVFIPKPRELSKTEFNSRIRMLEQDPYAIIDFANRPDLNDDAGTKNRRAFYSINYFRDEIRPAFFLKPNEGKRNIIVITGIENMHESSSNAFLKVLEEPPADVLIIMTTDHVNALLPTILSRCQVLKCTGLSTDEISLGLQQRDHLTVTDAQYMARISGGNYAIARFWDVSQVKSLRSDVVKFMRMSYTQDASEISTLSIQWVEENNAEGILVILNLLELFIKDILVYMHTNTGSLLINEDQVEVISRFVHSLREADLETMASQIESARIMIRQNVAPKYILTVLAIRFGYLMRGLPTPIHPDQPWLHLPALDIE
jgi:DNA polymerase-3 subunit delta'